MRILACVNLWKYSVVSNREEEEEDAEGKRCAEILRRLLEQKKVQNINFFPGRNSILGSKLCYSYCEDHLQG